MRHAIIDQLVGQPVHHQEAQHIDRLQQVLLDRAVADVAGDAGGQARHAGKGPADHRQQVIGDQFVVVVAGDLVAAAAHALEYGVPEEYLRDDRQEAHERAQREIDAIRQSLGDADAEDGQVEHEG